MRLSFPLAAVKDQRKKKKKTKVGGRRSIVKADSRSTITSRDIPEDILVEILVRLPADSLMRFKCVSKIWSSLISSRYFTNLFYKFSSSKRERRVFICTGDCMLFSLSLINMDATDSFLQLNHDLTLPGMFVNAVRGLICVRRSAGIRIINFATRQVLSLPLVESSISFNGRWNYFGYDPVNDEYKVLNVISYLDKFISRVSNRKSMRFARRVQSETKILVLGAGGSWRNTKSTTYPSLSQRPHSQGISINGVLYYVSWYSHVRRCVLMSFDLNSEEFNVVEFPMESHIRWDLKNDDGYSLMNYQDQVTVIDDSRLTTEYILDLWVLDDAGKSKWSHKFVVLPYDELRMSLNIDDLKIRGTSRSREIWLSERFVNENKTNTLVVYNVEKNRITRGFIIEPPCPKIRNLHLWEDVENIIYLEA